MKNAIVLVLAMFLVACGSPRRGGGGGGSSDGPESEDEGVLGFWTMTEVGDGAFAHVLLRYDGDEVLALTLSDPNLGEDLPDGSWPAGASVDGPAVQGTLQVYEGSDPISVSVGCGTGLDVFPSADPADLSTWALYEGSASFSADDGSLDVLLDDGVFIDDDGDTTSRSIDATFNLCSS